MDEELLAEALRAEERLIDAERDAEVYRAEFHHAVRRLHLHGASLRELAGALGLSHQRVHQIVESAGGSRRWLRQREPAERAPRRPGPDLACTFCGQGQAQVQKLIAGPHVYICNACVSLAQNVISSDPAPGGPFVPVTMTRGQPEFEPKARLACSFCGKKLHQVAGVAATAPPASGLGKRGLLPRAAICTECLNLCAEIVAEDLADTNSA
jgi:ClpX C4-type zinc finger